MLRIQVVVVVAAFVWVLFVLFFSLLLAATGEDNGAFNGVNDNEYLHQQRRNNLCCNVKRGGQDGPKMRVATRAKTSSSSVDVA